MHRLNTVGDVISVESEIPGSEEFCALRVASGLSAKDEAAAAVALPRSLFAVTARDDGQLIGMARVVGDGLHVQVVDVAVHPDHQGRGISRTLKTAVVDYLRTLPPSTTVSLFADVDWLYHKFGFSRPKQSVGMFFVGWDELPPEP